jgi:hypothetical protein
MKILYLTFYFEPDLCAGSFRNTSLVRSLSKKLGNNDIIDVITTFPNRYRSYKKKVLSFEEKGNLKIYRIKVPWHKSGFIDQINSFKTYFFETQKLIKKNQYDLIFASSSRLFTAYLGYVIARKIKKPLYLDIRDIFVDTIGDVLKNPIVKAGIIPIIKTIERKTMDNATHINLISGGFLPYFKKFKCNSYSNFSNGIDSEFLDLSMFEKKNMNRELSILYAGNIGEGQGLEKIIPPSASMLGDNYKFIIIGDGGAKNKLQNEIYKKKLTNVELKSPVDRNELKRLYNDADYLFLHLNGYKAFEKVLPSKIFELAAYNKPIIAGVSGFSYKFIKENISNVILFRSCDVNDLVKQLREFDYKTEYRAEFIRQFKRETINAMMVQSILEFIS